MGISKILDLYSLYKQMDSPAISPPRRNFMELWYGLLISAAAGLQTHQVPQDRGGGRLTGRYPDIHCREKADVYKRQVFSLYGNSFISTDL